MGLLLIAGASAAQEAVSESASGKTRDGAAVPPRRVLVIGIDGTRTDALQAANTPHLDRLIQDGQLWTNTQILGDRPTQNDTVSGPGWTSFLTGVWADKHGVNDNRFEGRNVDAYPHFFARVRHAYPAARMGSFVDWKPIDDYLVRDADVRVCHESHGASEYEQNDGKLATAAAAFLRDDDPHVVMVYFGMADESGHAHGFHPSVRPYVDAIARVDERVGQVLNAMQERPNYAQEQWLVVVSTDHGGQGTGHGSGHEIPAIRQTWLIVSGDRRSPNPPASSVATSTEPSPSYLVDVSVTALEHLGIPLDPAWQLDGKALRFDSPPHPPAADEPVSHSRKALSENE
ncbi:sulfatase-like hydrolase/transferase [Roseiconus nitratireducens]|uniref:Sulfatase-like hydrolase/transferase n=2 Tax=Roseiconus nitratireducens TaxID=2605748 RepID=A0A5M6DMK3_9BACT|nr:sulfatase-like hydrolase/transferase [Roseiconus nitratireducens]